MQHESYPHINKEKEKSSKKEKENTTTKLSTVSRTTLLCPFTFALSPFPFALPRPQSNIFAKSANKIISTRWFSKTTPYHIFQLEKRGGGSSSEWEVLLGSCCMAVLCRDQINEQSVGPGNAGGQLPEPRQSCVNEDPVTMFGIKQRA